MNTPTAIPGLTRANISSHLQKHRKKIAAKSNDTYSSEGDDFELEFELAGADYERSLVTPSPLEFNPGYQEWRTQPPQNNESEMKI